MKNIIKNTKAFLFDLDGTIYLDDCLIGDVKNTLNILREKDITVGYLTNNSSKTDDEYVEKLKKLDIYKEDDIFYSSLDGAVDFLNFYYKDLSVYPVATKKVTEHLTKAGVKVVNTGEIADIVLLTFDKELNYEKIVWANHLIVKGAKYFATHPDAVCPAKDVDIPDLGSFIEMFKISSKREPDVIIGKPYTVMADNIMRALKLENKNVTMVGDRLHTDIAFGVNSKINTILVLSGESTLETLEQSPVKPDIVLKDVNEIIKYL